ncbi:MAG: glycosyltransferase family 4 protein [Anaerolineae bacterium]|jgi:glycosyltransferase involved in cell wall biosynthesis|nr:glycosyltransferase family 4 protein [Anaerolineae bacterium]
MRILIVLTYYRPHTSGLTIYAERLATAFAKRGHAVTILTSQYDRALPREEIKDGIRIVRAPVLFRISKGVVMPTFGGLASKLVAEHDVIQLHLPQFDAAGVALRGRILQKPTVITYHCDLIMPPGLLSGLANQAVKFMSHLAARFTHRIVTYTQDYADHSPYMNRYLDKVTIIPPPVVLPPVDAEQVRAFAARTNPDGRKPIIGMAARFATEKGVEVLLAALPPVLEKFPEAQVWFAGPYENITGEEGYFARLSGRIHELEASGHWVFTGSLDPAQMAAFYPNLDVLVLPSLNSTESFGLVQIEAMMNGVPCVTADLPGVRQPVRIHNMGEIFPVGDSEGMARAMINVLSRRKTILTDDANLLARYNPDATAVAYENLFVQIAGELAASERQVD